MDDVGKVGAPMDRDNLNLIGAGAGDLTVAGIAALLGSKVALPKKERLGGDGLAYGCVPSQALLKAALRRAPCFSGLGLYFLAILLTLSLAQAQSPLLTAVETTATTYHQDPTRLDRLREDLEHTIKTDSRIANLLALARVSFIWGEIRATTREEKLAAYDRGRQIAKRVVELEPRNVEGRFWYASNTARWGHTKGIVRSLFLLPTVQEEIQIMLRLDPQFTPVYALAGNVYYEVPGLLGGDVKKAEEMFRKGLELDPHFTHMRVGLAKTLLKQGRVAEAQHELEAVLAEQTPSNRADWTLKDTKEARQWLDTIVAKSTGQEG